MAGNRTIAPAAAEGERHNLETMCREARYYSPTVTAVGLRRLRGSRCVDGPPEHCESGDGRSREQHGRENE